MKNYKLFIKTICKRLSKVDGVGLITATALLAAVGIQRPLKMGGNFPHGWD